ncbi:DUF2993 domain-containing protein [Leptolyngbya sp. FACHB-261]|uniref:LmeA family phospholipid-binding protein n=1 Tax=Leptolyngbya sp. FACHB-261 TaxID=2692806 RepID=UPI001688F93D|nr:DUF2993 domain-containing protein [Leptolyngbya sp. FACHB-261]MBD2099421.1 DUF2993 domain-containing protein [Leptolyngbya sp. FACHB-261]
MELIALILSGLFSLAGSGGLVAERLSQSLLRDQIQSADKLEVRIDNRPNYQILQGHVDRLRVAGRGVVLRPTRRDNGATLRLQAVDLETDPIDLNPSSLQLRRPLGAAVRLVLRAEDLNQALQSPAAQCQLQRLGRGLGPGYTLSEPQVEFLSNGRIRLRGSLRRGNQDPNALTAVFEAAPQVQQGARLLLNQPSLTLNGQPVPLAFYQRLLDGLSQEYDLRRFQSQGITARVLQLNSTPGELELVAYVRTNQLPARSGRRSRRVVGETERP